MKHRVIVGMSELIMSYGQKVWTLACFEASWGHARKDFTYVGGKKLYTTGQETSWPVVSRGYGRRPVLIIS